jgi:hypothetical protein
MWRDGVTWDLGMLQLLEQLEQLDCCATILDCMYSCSPLQSRSSGPEPLVRLQELQHSSALGCLFMRPDTTTSPQNLQAPWTWTPRHQQQPLKHADM